MHLKNPLLFGLMAILLLGGTITPGLSQSVSESKIVINEVEFNPYGSDAGLGTGGSGINSKTTTGTSGSQEYVELYNPSNEEIDIGGWELVPTASWKKLVIPQNTIIMPNSFLALTHVNYWFKDFGESVSLYDINGNLIDETPLLKDQDDSATSWQRITDGLDSNSITDWELKRMTPKSSNGVLEEIIDSEFTLTGSVDKSQYIFDEYLIISGTVSELLYTEKPYFSPELLKISVTGPDYFKNIAIFPDRSLEYSTTLNIQEVYGFSKGDYDVIISYGENNIVTNFSITDELTSNSTESEAESVTIFTDKTSYIPGETVILSADTNSSIEFGGLDYTVTNPNGEIIFEGTIFENEKFSTVYQSGGGQIYPFSAQLFMSPINPVYGTYQIEGEFKHQNTFTNSSYEKLSATTSFLISEDVKEDVAISLETDKSVYSLEDTITITGRSNDVWTEDVQLSIEQTSLFKRTTSTSSDNRIATHNPFSLTDSLRLEGDGRFSYTFKIVDSVSENYDYSHLYGDYKIKVSEYFGNSFVTIRIVEDPESFEDKRTPLGLKTNESEYVLGTKMSISGTVLDYDYKISNNVRNYVEVTIKDSNGKILTYNDHQQKTGYTNCYTNDCSIYDRPLIFTAIPDSVGVYGIDLILYPNQFDFGEYTLTAEHTLSGITESVEFSVISSQKYIVPENETRPPISVELEKDVYYVGEKLLVKGNVIPKDVRILTDSSAGTTGQEMPGSSYTNNFGLAAMNYVEVSIPYPQTLIFTKSAAWKTIPDEDDNYTGGGGSGGGGSYYENEDGEIIRGDRGDKDQADRHTGYDGTQVLQKQKKILTDMKFKAYPDENGDFSGEFDLRAGIFSTGTYLVKVNYFGHHFEQTVNIIDTSLKGGLQPEVYVNLDRTEYIPGETVRISGGINNAYYYDSVSVIIETPDVSKINCLAGQQCGFGNTEKKLRVQEGVEGPTYYWNYKIPNSENSLGKYTVVVDTHFGQTKHEFFVVNESEIFQNSKPSPVSKKSIEKFNRISESEIPISLTEKISEDVTLSPRVLQGSLFTSARGEESDVNLRITTNNQCVIGQSMDCLVSESTRKPGEIYSIVSIDDINYKIRYSGNDVRLEKFSIVPEDPNASINISDWNVEIIKDEQPSRFYYKVSYVNLE